MVLLICQKLCLTQEKKTDGKYQHVINTGSKVMNLIIQPDPILWESTSHVTNTEP